MEKTVTPVELKDIKPGDVVRAEYQRGSTLLTAAGPVKEVRLNLSDVVFGIGDESGLSFWLGSDYYLLSRPEKVIDKEDLRLGQRVRIEMQGLNGTVEGTVVTLWGSDKGELKGGQLLGGNFYLDAITKVVLLS